MSNLALLTNKLAERFGMQAGNDLTVTLKSTCFNTKETVSDAQMQALLIVANEYGLNPFTREIYAFPDKKNGIVPVVGVDGWSRIINNHPQLNGIDFRYSEKMVSLEGASSQGFEWVECIIYRKDREQPTVVREYIDEVYRAPFKSNGYDVKGPWQTHPKRFHRHKALIQCARVAFGFTGIFEQDEAERIIESPVKNMGVVEVVDSDYLAYEAATLPMLQNAASNGIEALQSSFSALEKTPHKAELWKRYAAQLKETAAAGLTPAIVGDEFVKGMGE